MNPKADDKIKTYENHLDEREARWFAVYTRYKREKLVASRLREKNIEVYLPLQRFTRRYARKVKKVELPLISCYIFVRITKKEYVSTLDTPDVVQFVRFSKNLISIPEREMKIMQRVVGENIEIEVQAGVFSEGDIVEVIGGALTGLKGKLINKGNKNFLVELTNLSYSMMMQIDSNLLQPVNEAAMAR